MKISILIVVSKETTMFNNWAVSALNRKLEKLAAEASVDLQFTIRICSCMTEAGLRNRLPLKISPDRSMIVFYENTSVWNTQFFARVGYVEKFRNNKGAEVLEMQLDQIVKGVEAILIARTARQTSIPSPTFEAVFA